MVVISKVGSWMGRDRTCQSRAEGGLDSGSKDREEKRRDQEMFRGNIDSAWPWVRWEELEEEGGVKDDL